MKTRVKIAVYSLIVCILKSEKTSQRSTRTTTMPIRSRHGVFKLGLTGEQHCFWAEDQSK